MSVYKYVVVILLLAFVAGCTNDKNELPEPEDGCVVPPSLTWDNSIHALIQTKCAAAGCHVPDSAGGNGFDFSTYAAVKEKINSGIFQQRVFVLRDMPPPETTFLTACELKLLKTWVENGAPQ
jgi:hypothetical protein